MYSPRRVRIYYPKIMWKLNKVSENREDEIPTWLKTTLVVVIILVVWAGFSVYDISKKRTNAENMFLSELEEANLTVFFCSINSPSITVTIEGPEGFIMVAKSLDQRNIYRTYRSTRTFYVFNEHLTMAWVYDVEWKDFKNRITVTSWE